MVTEEAEMLTRFRFLEIVDRDPTNHIDGF